MDSRQTTMYIKKMYYADNDDNLKENDVKVYMYLLTSSFSNELDVFGRFFNGDMITPKTEDKLKLEFFEIQESLRNLEDNEYILKRISTYAFYNEFNIIEYVIL